METGRFLPTPALGLLVFAPFAGTCLSAVIPAALYERLASGVKESSNDSQRIGRPTVPFRRESNPGGIRLSDPSPSYRLDEIESRR
jgi:hypothetical protein